jgi:2-polyprenyl-3-methyl-5-hydroxy-6-metoxy-1,4-benzoquinol methylase
VARWVLFLDAVAFLAAPSSLRAEEPRVDGAARQSSTYMGRTIAPPMSYSGADWLTRESRDAEENPRQLLKALELKPGQTVCDFGCGNGFYTLQMASLVGPRGLVYAVDIQSEMLKLLAERAGPRGLANVRTVLATADDPGLGTRRFDIILMVDVYHELADPAAVLKAARASLKPRGRIALAEFRQEDPAVPILPLHKMSIAQVMRELPANGLKLVGQHDGLPWQHLLFFARDDSPHMSIPVRGWAPQR